MLVVTYLQDSSPCKWCDGRCQWCRAPWTTDAADSACRRNIGHGRRSCYRLDERDHL